MHEATRAPEDRTRPETPSAHRPGWGVALSLLLTGCQVILGIEPLGGDGGDGGGGGSGGGGGCVDCGGACVDLSSDPAHCGACNRVCDPATCTDGVCKTTPFADGVGKISDLAADGATVYFADVSTGVVGRVVGGVQEPLYAGEATPFFVEESAGQLLFESSGDVKGGPVVPGNPASLIQGSLGKARAMAARGSAIALATDTGIHLFGPTTYLGVLDLGPTFFGVGVAENHVFWSENASGEIRFAEINGATLGTLYGGRASPSLVAAWDKQVFWAEGSQVFGGNVLVDPPQQIGSSPAMITALAADEKGVYWADPTSVRGVYHGTQQPFVIATSQLPPTGLVTDASRVFWGAGGVILSAPK